MAVYSTCRLFIYFTALCRFFGIMPFEKEFLKRNLTIVSFRKENVEFSDTPDGSL
jgi:hypothetical protein